MSVTAIENLDILIVEDSATQALLLKDALESQQLRVRVAPDGLDALEQVQARHPDAIISDISMPRMNGFDFCNRLRADPALAKIPVILLTGLNDPMDVIKSIACGADSFLTKPCEVDFLLSTIRDVIANKQIKKESDPGQRLAFFFNGKHHALHIDQVQITNLLLSTYLNAVQKNEELEQSYRKLNAAYEEIMKKNESLKALNAQKNQFLAVAAHDLRNPLGVITGYCNLLKPKVEASLDEKSSKMLEKIHASSTFMLKLINDLLDVSVIESEVLTLHLADVDLSELIQENLMLLKATAETKNIELTFTSKTSVPKVTCDPHKMAQVVSNLITNAIKSSRPGGTVEIALESSLNEVTLTVTDAGSGLSAETQKELFHAPSSCSQFSSLGEKSANLGMGIAYKIVSKHHGKIWLDSRAGKGTKYFVSLPKSPKKG